MKGRAVLTILLLLTALALATGCTAPQGGAVTPGPTQVQTATQTTVEVPATTPEPSITIPPGPVVTAPPRYEVAVQVTRNPNSLDPFITVTFSGGLGQYILSKITVTVAPSHGQVIQEVIPQSGPGEYSVGDSVTLMGTTGPDRIIVVATILGVDYKIYDQSLVYNANP